MKTLHFTLFILALLWVLPTQAQEDDSALQYPTHRAQGGWWTLGINAGTAYQQSDVCDDFQYGAGLTLAKNIYYRPTAPISFDIRGRLMYARTAGADHEANNSFLYNNALNGIEGPNYVVNPNDENNSGLVYNNYQTDHGELALEGVLYFNRLKEKRNILLSLFGGAGIDYAHTKTDQIGGGESIYDYSTIDPNSGKNSILNNLGNLRDGRFETNADGYGDGPEFSFMPSAGIGLGYQVTPRFSIGLEHKATFAMHDYLDGEQYNNAENNILENDLWHYSSLNLRWRVNPGKQKTEKPLVKFTVPNRSPAKSFKAGTKVEAVLRNVDSESNIRFIVNGEENRGFTFNTATDKLVASVMLNRGINKLKVEGRNSRGRASDEMIIEYFPRNKNNEGEPDKTPTKGNASSGNSSGGNNSGGTNSGGSTAPPPPPPPNPGYNENRPVVDIRRPADNGGSVNNSRLNLEASIRNIDRKDQIEVFLNRRPTRQFNYNSRSGILNATLNLQEGRNSIQVVAKNSRGDHRDSRTIYYSKENTNTTGERPTIRFTQPSSNPFTIRNSRTTVKAIVKHVTNSNNIVFDLNGKNINNFNFTAGTGQLSAMVDLKEGKNTISITATNAKGRATASTEIIYEKEQIFKNPPVVTITHPQGKPVVSKPNYTLKATTKNVNSSKSITLKLNGEFINSYNFDVRTGNLTADVLLKQGVNRVSLTGSNPDGKDTDTQLVTYKPKKEQPLPVITITNPVKGATIVNSPSFNFKATLKNVASGKNIAFSVNGIKSNKFNYDARSGKFSAGLNLNKGSNNIRISATNGAGKDVKTTQITYKEAAPQVVVPKVTLTQPARGMATTKENTYTINATIKGVQTKKEITFTSNGKPISVFTYKYNPRSKTGAFSATVNLKNGKNTYTIKAQNAAGKDSKNITINKQSKAPAVKKPTVNITAPTGNPIIVYVNNPEVKATVSEVTQKSQIAVKVNGRNFTNFTFDGRKKQVKFRPDLKPVNNQIEITATNKAGKGTDKVDILNRTPTNTKPVITIEVPRNNPHNSGLEKESVRGKIMGINAKADIEIRLNGTKLSNFSYNINTKAFAIDAAMKTGRNELVIIAKNSGGTSTKTLVINRSLPLKKPGAGKTGGKNKSNRN